MTTTITTAVIATIHMSNAVSPLATIQEGAVADELSVGSWVHRGCHVPIDRGKWEHDNDREGEGDFQKLCHLWEIRAAPPLRRCRGGNRYILLAKR